MAKIPGLLLFLFLIPAAAAAQTNYDTSPMAQTGVRSYGTYFSGDVDHVNVYNGNVTVNIPLFSVPGRELSAGLSITHNSRLWQATTCEEIPEEGPPVWLPCGMYTGGWEILTPFSGNEGFSVYLVWDSVCVADGGVWNPRYSLNGYWTDDSGARRRYAGKVLGTAYGSQSSCMSYHEAPASTNSKTLASIDSDGSVLYTGDPYSSSDVANIKFRDGSTRYLRTAYNTGVTYDFVTANGNYLVKGSYGLPSQDTLGRTITFECVSPCEPDSYQVQYKIKDTSANWQTYKIQFDEMEMADPYEYLSAFAAVISYVELPNGKRYTFEYNSIGQISKAILPSGAYTRYVYGSPGPGYSPYVGLYSRSVSADGTSGGEKTWTYAATFSGGLGYVTVTNPDSTKSRHTFGLDGLETDTEWIDASGYTVKRVSRSWSNSGVESNNQPNNPKVVTTTTAISEGATSQSVITYDSDNFVTQEKVYDWGMHTAGTLVLQKDLTYTTIAGIVKKLASETLTAINPANDSWTTQGKTEYFYDDYSLTDRGSGVPNHTHSTTASGRGLLTRVRKYKDASNYLETQMKYDNVGNLVETIDPLSHSTTIDFTDNFTDTGKNGSLFAFPKKVTNALSQYATSKYDWNTGLVKEITNVRGYTTTTVYDAMNRVTSVTEPNSKVTTYAYDDDNRVTTKEVTVDSSGNKGRVKTYFDGLYRVTQTRTNDPDGEYAVDTEYDGNGRVKKTSNPYRVSGGSAIWTQTTYDALSRPSVVTAQDSSTVKYAYFNNQTTTTDQSGNQRRYTYNILGQLTKVEEPSPSLYTPVATTYKYYGFGPLYQSNQSSQTRTWVYNWLGQTTSQTLPESGATTFTFDGGGRLSTKTDARSIVTTMAYDNINRVTQRSYSDSTPTVGFTYDQSSQTGLRTAMSDGLGSVAYTYDTMDRLTQESRTLTGISGTFSTSYVYNVKGDVTQMTYPSGRVVNFGYATGGGCCNSRLASVADGTTSTTLVNSITFNAAGGVTAQTLNPGSNAVTQSFTYNNRLQLTDIEATKGGTAIMDFAYDYGTSSTNTGRVLKRTDAIQPEHSANYAYDSLYRLAQAVGADGSWSIAWALDTWGNRTSQTPLGLATSKVGSPSIAYTNNKNQSYTYDASGNTTNDGANNFAYNAENQQVSMGGGASTYAFDGEGRRMKKVSGGETTFMFYGPGGLLCEFTTTNTGATGASSSDKTIYRTSEKTGTAALLFNTSGTMIENNRTLPYGEAWLTDVASANDKKFTTYERDKESGLDYAMARMYAGTAGRFTSPDKGEVMLSKPTQMNRYTYGNLDPVNHSDPSGNYPVTSELECPMHARLVVTIGWWVALPREMGGTNNIPFPVSGSDVTMDCDDPGAVNATAAEQIGGGGGGPAPNGFQRNVWNSVTKALEKLRRGKASCDQLLAHLGVARQDLTNALDPVLGRTNYIDGTTAATPVEVATSPQYANASGLMGRPMSAMFAPPRCNPGQPCRQTTAFSWRSSGDVYLTGNFDWTTIIHEVLHKLIPEGMWDDTSIQTTLNARGYRTGGLFSPKVSVNGPSSQINDVIKKQCN